MTLPPNRGISARLFLALFCAIALCQASYAQLALPLTLGCSWPFKTTPDTDPNQTIEQNAACTANYMGPYYPQATYCQKTVYEQGGWQACFQNPTQVRKN